MHGLRQISPPAIEPVSLSLVKKHLRLEDDFTDDDDLISLYIGSAREFCEKYTNRSFFTTSWLLTLDHFPWPWGYGSSLPTSGTNMANELGPWIQGSSIRLPRPRCIGVTSIQYVDGNDQPVVVDASTYTLDVNSEPARLVPANGGSWPLQNLYQPGSVAVVYTAGSFVYTKTEALTVPVAGPFELVPSKASDMLGVTSLKNGNAAVQFIAQSNGVAVDASQAGLQLSLTYTYGEAPKGILLAILFLVAHFYQNREASIEVALNNIPYGVERLLNPYVFTSFGF
jgi:hypothetical protein